MKTQESQATIGEALTLGEVPTYGEIAIIITVASFVAIVAISSSPVGVVKQLLFG